MTKTLRKNSWRFASLLLIIDIIGGQASALEPVQELSAAPTRIEVQQGKPGASTTEATTSAFVTQTNMGDVGKSTPIPSYQGQPPFSADELMEKLLHITASHDGKVNRHQAEKTFGVKLPMSSKLLNGHEEFETYGGTWYYARPGQDWYFNLGVVEGKNGYSWFGFSFNSKIEIPTLYNPVPLDDLPIICIEMEKFQRKLEGQGWKASSGFLYGADGLWLGVIGYQRDDLGYMQLLFSPARRADPDGFGNVPGPAPGHCLERLLVGSTRRQQR